jgi:hypothetical protein
MPIRQYNQHITQLTQVLSMSHITASWGLAKMMSVLVDVHRRYIYRTGR